MRPFWLILLLALAGDVGAAELTAQLDRSRITENETVVLSLVLSGDVRGDVQRDVRGDLHGEPDLAPLAEDFELIDQTHTTRMSLINGLASSSREWRLELAPRRAGVLTIPPLRVGNLASSPLTLEVADAAAGDVADGEREVYVEVSATPEAPYVQARVDYRVRLLSRVTLLEPRLSEPEVDGAIVQKMGEDRQSSETIGGERYRVIERRYAIFPQRSGALEIRPPVLTAAVQGARAAPPPAIGFGQDPFGPIGDILGGTAGPGGLPAATRRVRVRGATIALEVRPQPVGGPVPWLPAESVQVSDEWVPSASEVEVGAAMTRTVTITAAGVTSAQLPELDLEAPPGVKLYPDPPRTEDLTRGEVPVAVKQIKVALVATKPGLVTLPEIRLPWWDTATDEPREALVPGRVLAVKASTSSASRALSDGATGDAPVPGEGTGSNGGLVGLIEEPLGRLGAHSLWPWLTALLAAGWLATVVLWWRDRRRRMSATTEPRAETLETERPRLSLVEARADVERSCHDAGPREVRDALLTWAAVRWPDDPPRGLGGLAVRLDSPEAAAVVTVLERRLYAGQAEPWDGPVAWAALAPALTIDDGGRQDAEESLLPELYPREA